MNRTAFLPVYLTVLGLLPWPQFSDSAARPDSIPPESRPLPLTARPVEYAPLHNEPFFPGGQPALDAFLQTLEAYPPQARSAEIEGTVRVRFRVLPTGHLTEVRIVHSHGPLLDFAAVQIVLRMPRWYPAHQDGRAVACLVELSILFCFD